MYRWDWGGEGAEGGAEHCGTGGCFVSYRGEGSIPLQGSMDASTEKRIFGRLKLGGPFRVAAFRVIIGGVERGLIRSPNESELPTIDAALS